MNQETARNQDSRLLGPGDFIALTVLAALLFLFYPGIFLVKAAPLTGDHLEQHYPWACYLAAAVKQFRLPFWTPYIHCGFPIAAESQIGIFYLPNLILDFLLPFNAAYSYTFILHSCLSGFGVFLYGRRIGLGSLGAGGAAAVFLFGAAYGGAYYNITSLKTVCWLPLALYFFESFLLRKKKSLLFWIGICAGESMLAGYLQVALLTWMIFGLYVILRIFFFDGKRNPARSRAAAFAAVCASGLVASLIALPQIYLTYKLAMVSNRAAPAEGYAYLGSLSPAALVTLFFPPASLVLKGNNLFAGNFSVFLVILVLLCRESRASNYVRLWGTLALISILLCLGKWSPLYLLIIKLTHFYSFRTPAKFLVFFCLAVSILSGFGAELLWRQMKNPAEGLSKKAAGIYLLFAGFVLAVCSLIFSLVTVFRAPVEAAGRWYVRNQIYAKPGHPHPLSEYYDNLHAYLDQIRSCFSFSKPGEMTALAMFIAGLFLVFLFRNARGAGKIYTVIGIFFLAADLYTASGIDIQQDMASYRVLQPRPASLQKLLEESGARKLIRLYGLRGLHDRLPLVPSMNFLYGFKDIGAYTPFVKARYFETIGLFGNINDSNYAYSPEPAWVLARLPLLSALGVSHILSKVPLENPRLTLLVRDAEADCYVYRNSKAVWPVFFQSSFSLFSGWEDLKGELMKEGFDPAAKVLFEESEARLLPEWKETVPAQGNALGAVMTVENTAERHVWNIRTTGPGFLIVMDTYDPAWKAWLDGSSVPVIRAYGLFQAVYLPRAGSFNLELIYKPFG